MSHSPLVVVGDVLFFKSFGHQCCMLSPLPSLMPRHIRSPQLSFSPPRTSLFPTYAYPFCVPPRFSRRSLFSFPHLDCSLSLSLLIHILGLPCLEVTPLVSLTPLERSRSHRITVHPSTHGRYNGLISKLTVWCTLAFFLANGNELEYLTHGDTDYEMW